MRRLTAGLFFCASSIMLIVISGCSSDRTAADVAAKNKSNIQRLANMYSAFQNMKSSAGPKDEAEFKDFIKNYAADKLKMMSIDANNLDEAFKSERDGQAFKVRYKVGGGKGSVAPVVFETKGKEGKKQVGFTGGSESKVEDVDDARYNDLWAGKESSGPQGGPSGNAGAPGGNRGGVGSGRPAGAPTGGNP